MSDVITHAKVGVSGVNNGAAVVFAQETGTYNRYDSQINQYVTSGTMFALLNDRFDEHYGGGVGNQAGFEVVQIASGSNTTSAIDLYGSTLAGIWFPSTFTGATLTFTSAPSINGTYAAVNNIDSSGIYSVTVSSGYQPVDINVFAGIRYLKVISSSNQAVDRILNLSVKGV